MFEIIDIIEEIVIIVIKSRGVLSIFVHHGIELINPSKGVIICMYWWLNYVNIGIDANGFNVVNDIYHFKDMQIIIISVD